MAHFSHPNIVGLIGFVDRNDHPLIVAEFCEHGCLLDFLRQHKELLSMQALLKMAKDVAEAMFYLSSTGFVHRDLAVNNKRYKLIDYDKKVSCNMISQ